MVLAVNRAVGQRRGSRGLRLDRQHQRLGGRLRGRSRAAVPRGAARRQGGARQAGPGAWRPGRGWSWSTATSTRRWPRCGALARRAWRRSSTRSTRIASPGQQTVAFEIVDALGESPEAVALPVGNAGNITAAWAGFVPLCRCGHHALRSPAADAGLPGREGAAPIVHGAPVEKPETVATAIRIGNPASWQGAEAARDESGGVIEAVTDEEILEMQRRIVGAWRASSASPPPRPAWPAWRGWPREGRIHASEGVVCILTGHGLKDPDAVARRGGQPAAGRLRPRLDPAGNGPVTGSAEGPAPAPRPYRAMISSNRSAGRAWNVTPLPVMVSAASSELTIASSVASMAAQNSAVMWSSSSMVSGFVTDWPSSSAFSPRLPVAKARKMSPLSFSPPPPVRATPDGGALRQAAALVRQQRRVRGQDHDDRAAARPQRSGPGISVRGISRPTGTPSIISRSRHAEVGLHQRAHRVAAVLVSQPGARRCRCPP